MVASVIGWQAAGADLTAVSGNEATRWEFKFRGKPVMVYSFNPQQYKPYIKELRTLRGDNVLRDAPHDHLHHHALMYAIKVNGVNFWEETGGSGVEKVISTKVPECSRDAAGRPTATLVQSLNWLSPEHAFLPNSNAPVLLKEERTLTLVIDEPKQEVAVRWNSRFEVGNRTNVVVLTGSSYHGLGMRFPREFDPVATHITAAGKPDLANNRQDTTVHPWEAVLFDTPGNPATVALFGATGNARGDARFFAMRTPFAYVSATQGLDQEPLVYRQGDRFELNYLVTVYPELKSAEALSERSREWERSRGVNR